MEKNLPHKSQPTEAQIREDRLKAALKANMGRRKAQAKARTPQTGAQNGVKQNEGDT